MVSAKALVSNNGATAAESRPAVSLISNQTTKQAKQSFVMAIKVFPASFLGSAGSLTIRCLSILYNSQLFCACEILAVKIAAVNIKHIFFMTITVLFYLYGCKKFVPVFRIATILYNSGK